MFGESRRRLAVEPLEDRCVPSANFFAVGTDPGVPAVARLIDADTGAERFRVAPFGDGFTGGVRVAVADVTGDRVPDLVAAPGPGGGPVVRVFDGLTGQAVAGPLGSLGVFDPGFRGGLTVAAADVNLDGFAEVIAGAGDGGGPLVAVIDGKTGAALLNFFAFDPGFRGGVNVAAGDLDGDGRADVLAAPASDGGPQVAAFSVVPGAPTPTPLLSFFAYEPSYRGSVNLTTGDMNGDGITDIVTGPGCEGGPVVSIFRGTDAVPVRSFLAGVPTARTGVRVSVLYTGANSAPVIQTAILTSTGFLQNRFTTTGDSLGPQPGADSGSVAGPATRAGDAVQTWAEILTQTLWQVASPPTRSARALGVVGGAMFDAVNSVTGGFQPYLSTVPAAPGASAAAAAATAAHDTLAWLFPARTAFFDAALNGSLALVADPAARDAGAATGRAAAAAMIAARQNDGADTTVPYTPGTDPGDYQLTPPGFRPVLDPHWGSVTPFTLTSTAPFVPGPPPALDSAEYAADFNEVKALGGTTSTIRTAEQTEIAHFWADVPGNSASPPGHWFEIAVRLSREHGLTLTENARLFGLLGLALADASIVCWDAKNIYDFWRPVTAIRAADTDGNPATEADPTWTPLWATPNFQSYTSGHSTFSGAASIVLAAVFGPDTPFRAGTDDMPGVVRSFTSFAHAAEEAAESRLLGGIHYRFDNTAGLVCGRAIGEHVAANFLRPL
jgi:hypothetical protein